MAGYANIITTNVYTAGEFEKFARNIDRTLGELPTLAVGRLALLIAEKKMFNPSLGANASDPSKRGRYVGPGGRAVKGDLGTVYTVASNLARAVLELRPEVKFITVYPKAKKALAFDWIEAPPPVGAKFFKTYPRVFFAHTRVPIRISIGSISEEARQAYTSQHFQIWFAEQLRRGLIR